MFAKTLDGFTAIACLGDEQHICLPIQAACRKRQLGLGEADVWVRVALDAAPMIGLLSPLTTVLSLALSIFSALEPVSAASALPLLTALNALALGLLGPGAHSLDARIFGRRLLVIPSKDRNRL
ncbi:MAG: hypothetical protein ABI843_02990 [Dokdonella sp.]